MNKRNIAVIAGGDSSEIVISLRSARQVRECLDKDRYNVFDVSIQGREWVVQQEYPVDRNDFSFTDCHGLKTVFDYALIMIHGTPGENGILQGYFDLLGVPYSGCDVRSSAITFDKSACKKVLQGVSGVNLALEMIFRKGEKVDAQQVVNALSLPLFIKPTQGGSSFGVTKVKSAQQIEQALQEAFDQSCGVVMAEQYIHGTEVSQGVMVVSGKDYVLPVTELVSKNEFFDFQAKYTPGMTDEITPARISQEVKEKLDRTTLAIYKALGLKGIVRVDYIIRDEVPYFIEVNTTPGMSAASIVPQQWQRMGLSMGEAFGMIIEDSFR